MKLIQKRNLKQWERWRHCDIKSSIFLGGICIGSVSSGTGWLIALFGMESTFPLCWTVLYWCRNAKALGFFWPSFWLVMSHIIPAEDSKANQVQQGHDFFKVILQVCRSRKSVWMSDFKTRDTCHKESDFKRIDRVWEGKIV